MGRSLQKRRAEEAQKEHNLLTALIKPPKKCKYQKKNKIKNYAISFVDRILYNLNIDPIKISYINWTPRKYNKQSACIEYFKYKYCPYPIYPVFKSLLPHAFDGQYTGECVRCINLCLRICCGESLFRLQKKSPNILTPNFTEKIWNLTKKECHIFLNNNIHSFSNSINFSDVLTRNLLVAKTLSAGLNKNIVKSLSFNSGILRYYLDNNSINSFINFLKIHEGQYTADDLQNVMDYLRTCWDQAEWLSFTGRSWNRLVQESNGWHMNLGAVTFKDNKNEVHEFNPLNNVPDNTILYYGKKTIKFVISRLKTSRELINEGRQMHHCVGGYIAKCKDHKSVMYSVIRFDRVGTSALYAPVERTHRSTVEIEVSTQKIIQTRSFANKNNKLQTKKAIFAWARNNYLRI